MNFCSECGAKLASETSKFCGECGHRLVGFTEEVPSLEDQVKSEDVDGGPQRQADAGDIDTMFHLGNQLDNSGDVGGMIKKLGRNFRILVVSFALGFTIFYLINEFFLT